MSCLGAAPQFVVWILDKIVQRAIVKESGHRGIQTIAGTSLGTTYSNSDAPEIRLRYLGGLDYTPIMAPSFEQLDPETEYEDDEEINFDGKKAHMRCGAHII